MDTPLVLSCRANVVLACIALASGMAPSLFIDLLAEHGHVFGNHLFFQSSDVLSAVVIFVYIKRRARMAFEYALTQGLVATQDDIGIYELSAFNARLLRRRPETQTIPEHCPNGWLVQLYMESRPGILSRIRAEARPA